MAPSKTRIFVVEDHAVTARALKAFLETYGYSVEVAADVRSALKLAKRIEFDVLVCDLNLPDGNGWELMQRLSAKAPVRGIAFSAFDDPEHFARSKAAGFIEHVVKGAAPEKLLAAIKRAAETTVPPREARAADPSPEAASPTKHS
jgi:CheY-like chemotaxis protein